MKKIYYLILLLFALPFSTKASHFVGGEIVWECMNNGQYRFGMTLYRDCSGIPFIFANESISITGSPLPTNGISSIIMRPDSNAWVLNRNGDVSPSCTNLYGSQLSCASGNAGAIQAFYYRSDPITLTGTPPTAGWDFVYEAPCCPSGGIANILGGTAPTVLRASMFPTINNDPINVCFDSSPLFSEFPQTVLCRGSEQRYNHVVIDQEGDSIVYSLTAPLRGTATSNSPANYAVGFSSSSPTPGTNANANNIATTLNTETGEVRFAVYNSAGNITYVKAIRAESWRDGKKIAEVMREYPVTIVDCPTLPSGNVNTVPTVQLSGTADAFGTYRDTVNAGSTYNGFALFIDTNSTGVMSGIQTLTITPFGTNFTNNFSALGTCNTVSCATLVPAPLFDSTLNEYNYKSVGSQQLNLSWQPDTSHLLNGQFAKTHYFTFKCVDDHCSVPQISYRTLALTVVPPGTITSLNEIEESKETIQVYPNPFQDFLVLQGLAPTDVYQLEIRNAQGQLVMNRREAGVNLNSIQLEAESGIYFIRLTNQLGEQNNFKIVKQ